MRQIQEWAPEEQPAWTGANTPRHERHTASHLASENVSSQRNTRATTSLGRCAKRLSPPESIFVLVCALIFHLRFGGATIIKLFECHVSSCKRPGLGAAEPVDVAEPVVEQTIGESAHGPVGALSVWPLMGEKERAPPTSSVGSTLVAVEQRTRWVSVEGGTRRPMKGWLSRKLYGVHDDRQHTANRTAACTRRSVPGMWSERLKVRANWSKKAGPAIWLSMHFDGDWELGSSKRP